MIRGDSREAHTLSDNRKEENRTRSSARMMLRGRFQQLSNTHATKTEREGGKVSAEKEQEGPKDDWTRDEKMRRRRFEGALVEEGVQRRMKKLANEGMKTSKSKDRNKSGNRAESAGGIEEKQGRKEVRSMGKRQHQRMKQGAGKTNGPNIELLCQSTYGARVLNNIIESIIRRSVI